MSPRCLADQWSGLPASGSALQDCLKADDLITTGLSVAKVTLDASKMEAPGMQFCRWEPVITCPIIVTGWPVLQEARAFGARRLAIRRICRDQLLSFCPGLLISKVGLFGLAKQNQNDRQAFQAVPRAPATSDRIERWAGRAIEGEACFRWALQEIGRPRCEKLPIIRCAIIRALMSPRSRPIRRGSSPTGGAPGTLRPR
jgi:hypothetical protein